MPSTTKFVDKPGPIKHASFAVADVGNNTLVAAVTGKQIRLLSFFLDASGGANSVKFQSGAGGTDLCGGLDIGSDGQIMLPHNPAGWVQTATGELLNLALTSGTEVDGMLTYQEIDP